VIGNRIVLTNDYPALKAQLSEQFGANMRFFEAEDFLLENAREAVAEAYIASENLKCIVLWGNKFHTEAQNSLLKVLEEPPHNVCFIIFAPARNALLSTIRSRMLVYDRRTRLDPVATGINYERLDLGAVNEILSDIEQEAKTGKFDKFALADFIAQIFRECLARGVRFSEVEIEQFSRARTLAGLNTRAGCILAPLLLMVGRKNENLQNQRK